MQQWMRTRVLRTVGLLFGLSMMLTACDPADFFALFGGGVTDEAAAEQPADEAPEADTVGDEAGGEDIVTDDGSDSVGDEPDPVTEESDPVSEESDPVSEESDPVADDDEAPGAGSGGEHRCFREGGAADEA